MGRFLHRLCKLENKHQAGGALFFFPQDGGGGPLCCGRLLDQN